MERDVAQLGSAFVLGTKCHGFKSCHPYLLLLLEAVTRDTFQSDSIWTSIIHNFQFYDSIHMQEVLIGVEIFLGVLYYIKKRIPFFTVFSVVVRKRSQFSSVERGSPKPDVVGSNPTERDSESTDPIIEIWELFKVKKQSK